MEDEAKEAATGVEAAVETVPEPAPEPRQIYDLHIELAAGMTSALKAISEITPPEFTEGMVREDPIVEEGFHRLVVSYRHNEGGQLWSIRHASFETDEG